MNQIEELLRNEIETLNLTYGNRYKVYLGKVINEMYDEQNGQLFQAVLVHIHNNEFTFNEVVYMFPHTAMAEDPLPRTFSVEALEYIKFYDSPNKIHRISNQGGRRSIRKNRRRRSSKNRRSKGRKNIR